MELSNMQLWFTTAHGYLKQNPIKITKNGIFDKISLVLSQTDEWAKKNANQQRLINYSTVKNAVLKISGKNEWSEEIFFNHVTERRHWKSL